MINKLGSTTLNKEKKLTAIDLFCGAGGLSFGFENAGIEIIAGFDSCQDSLKTFTHNHKNAKGIYCDLSKPILGINEYTGVDILIGGPPCQGFSISGKRDPKDKRNNLYTAYIATLKQLKPKYFLMENVPNLVSMDNGKIKDKIIKDLSALGYSITYKIINAVDYGVPQNRRRVIFIGSLGKFMYIKEEIKKELLVSCSNAISDLPEDGVIDGESYTINPRSDYQTIMRNNSAGIWNHQITDHTEKTKKIISLVPDGGNYKDLPMEYQDTRKVNIAWTRYSSNKPSNTIDTGHRHHFHYKFNRVPTVRESARLQSFPDNFIFFGSKTSQYRQVGNAVPPILGFHLAKQIIEDSYAI